MAAIRGKDSKPEKIVRRVAHRLGYRFRLHRRDLPGKPDIVFPRLRKIVLVHGCFWHQHPGCSGATRPATRPEFWIPKLDANRARDRRISRELRSLGWKLLILWECQTPDRRRLAKRLSVFLSGK